ncbi:hypothetical protein RMSM_05308 [Rhodopirellula maiorica SM1]|uniref:Uncharacterized protein n=1 Tax=Rhodopirellula maiorica SM1 TaxID=1265738 RepID=M5RQY9_9BACT|nr:DUF2190 family protein [Rhodopirellula maiorica]EMI17782.1 hypothetical protein RMSM_05308 [Rhodopirellula maiorica SM1]
MNIRHIDGRYPFAAEAAYDPGDVLVRPDGSLALFDGMQSCAIGDRIDPLPLKAPMTVDVGKKTTDTFAKAANVYWDATNEEVTSTSTGNTLIGTSIEVAGSGTTKLHVAITL